MISLQDQRVHPPVFLQKTLTTQFFKVYTSSNWLHFSLFSMSGVGIRSLTYICVPLFRCPASWFRCSSISFLSLRYTNLIIIGTFSPLFKWITRFQTDSEVKVFARIKAAERNFILVSNVNYSKTYWDFVSSNALGNGI